MSEGRDAADVRSVKADLEVVWVKALQGENILDTDNFFELGGGWLQAMNMLFLVARRPGIKLTPDVRTRP